MSLFADLFEIAENKEVISKKNERKKWTAKEYQTKLGTGVMLTTPQESYPCPVVLNPNLKGWHRIYLGLISLHQNTYTHIKLSGDDGFGAIWGRTFFGTIFERGEETHVPFPMK